MWKKLLYELLTKALTLVACYRLAAIALWEPCSFETGVFYVPPVFIEKADALPK